jgi:metallophosphoesterase superfamily enzyme
MPEKFVALYDVHWGYERRQGHKVSLHDKAALDAALAFIKDFQPDHLILGGDILDCGAISHHNRNKPGAVEGLRLLGDARELRKALITPIEAMTKSRLVYHIGNHEDWLQDLTEAQPALEGIADIRSLLQLEKRWEVIPQGEASKLGKLVFIHGDQIRSGVMPARTAVETYERNVRLGHYHTFQTYTKTSAVEANGHTGTVVPCLCKKNPKYNEGAPNRWMQGFLYGWVNGPNRSFNDYVAVIVNGTVMVNGKVYGSR